MLFFINDSTNSRNSKNLKYLINILIRIAEDCGGFGDLGRTERDFGRTEDQSS